MNRIVLLSRLHAEVEPADYEKWVVETDYPLARGLTAIQTYEASRVENYIFGTDDHRVNQLIGHHPGSGKLPESAAQALCFGAKSFGHLH